jgi:hypothetical protein
VRSLIRWPDVRTTEITQYHWMLDHWMLDHWMLDHWMLDHWMRAARLGAARGSKVMCGILVTGTGARSVRPR